MKELKLIDAIRLLRGDFKLVELSSYLNESDRITVELCSYFRDGMYVPPHVMYQDITPIKLQTMQNADAIMQCPVLRIDFSPYIHIYVRQPDEMPNKYLHITVK